MLSFMEYITQAFSAASDWDPDNSYSSLTATARALLDFSTPNGLSLNLSSLSSPTSASSYTLRSTGPLTGSLAYLYTSLPLAIPHASAALPLPLLVPGHRPLRQLQAPPEPWHWEAWRGGRRVDRRAVLLYGRLDLPANRLEALYLRRPSPATLLRIAAVSAAPHAAGGSGGLGPAEPRGSVVVSLARDRARYSTEGLLGLDGMVLGLRGLYNFGADPRPMATEGNPSATADGDGPTAVAAPSGWRQPHGRFSAGAELYYGLLNKSGGMSTGLRFATMPHSGGSGSSGSGVAPYVMTLTLNPLMGNLSSTYAVRAGPALALCSRFDFNFYSYESGFTAGLELWRRAADSTDSAAAMTPANATSKDPGMGGVGLQEEVAVGGAGLDVGRERLETGDYHSWRPEDTAGVLKARVRHDGEIGVLWEGRAKELLYSFGLRVDFRQREQIFRGAGLEVQYSS